MTTRLILIRHGETDYTKAKRYCGFANPPLNKKGIRQARRLAGKLKNIRIDKVYSSDLKRAYQTARIIFKDRPIKKSKDLREMDFGILEGLKYEEAFKQAPKTYRKWISHPEKVTIPDGESLAGLDKRVRRRCGVIISGHKGKTIAVVTHGGPIRVILCAVFKYALSSLWRIEQKPGALNIIEYSEKSAPHPVRLNE